MPVLTQSRRDRIVESGSLDSQPTILFIEVILLEMLSAFSATHLFSLFWVTKSMVGWKVNVEAKLSWLVFFQSE
ncbi:mCG147979 [Mus musculus]|jgi:hypothetical protein|nr:mCG147979 [Mus musculus]